ncbi:MAG: hypothetical protein K2O34_11675 [Acetatifactor sp.]|nr:hypothetical protein [Acetatifactor sp.]
MYDSTVGTRYTYDSLGRITSVTTYCTSGEKEGSFPMKKPRTIR